MTGKRNQPYKGNLSHLTALFGDSSVQTDKFEAPSTIPIEKLCLPQHQPRRYFDPLKMQELTASVKQHGILEPLLVRPHEQGRYELVSGERRYRAAKTVGISEVPVVIRQFSDVEAWQISLVENLQREDLNPIEETEGILQLLAIRLQREVQEIPPLLYKMQHEAKGRIAQNVLGNSEGQAIQDVFTGLGLLSWESFVNSRLPLLKLPEDILETLRQGKIAYTKAQAIARVKNQEQRNSLLQQAVAEDLSLALIKERIANLNTSVSSEEKGPALKRRVDEVTRLVRKSKVWNNPQKQKRLEKLLSQIEELVSEK